MRLVILTHRSIVAPAFTGTESLEAFTVTFVIFESVASEAEVSNTYNRMCIIHWLNFNCRIAKLTSHVTLAVAESVKSCQVNSRRWIV